MSETDQIKEYVNQPSYRKALQLPDQTAEEYTMLAQGEYNRNYIFTHPGTGKKLLLRINFGSQMHLKNQIEYEYKTLKLLEHCGRTPEVYYVDGSLRFLPYGVMVMEYLPGQALDYRTDMLFAAECLADIHSVHVTDSTHLIAPENPLLMILEECRQMFSKYEESDLADPQKVKKIREMLQLVWKKADAIKEVTYRCCINTELNSSNFLINGKGRHNYLIDWEKPLYGDPAQDLGHFLAPTTTFWKTDMILNREQMQSFIQTYIECVRGRFPVTGLADRTMVYLPVTCLRGITWCAMAWIEYRQCRKAIVNPSTAEKLDQYLDWEFLEKIDRFIRP